jgi:hypothetical protein
MQFSTAKEATVKLNIPKVQFWEPRKNLLNKSSRRNTERDFTIAFARAYISQIKSLHRRTARTQIDFAREVPMNGLGIADFVVVSWNPNKLIDENSVSNVTDFSKTALPVIRAFELKMSNWRRALMQAHRYKYFADVSIVVLPHDKMKIASSYLSTFKSVKVGLWGFNPRNNRIITRYTPRLAKPLAPQYKPRAIELVSKASKSQHIV